MLGLGLKACLLRKCHLDIVAVMLRILIPLELFRSLYLCISYAMSNIMYLEIFRRKQHDMALYLFPTLLTPKYHTTHHHRSLPISSYNAIELCDDRWNGTKLIDTYQIFRQIHTFPVDHFFSPNVRSPPQSLSFPKSIHNPYVCERIRIIVHVLEC